MPNIVLKCDQITKRIGNKKIVDNFSLELYEGDILGFVGPNGAGKTTTIKLILGLSSLTSGKIEITEKDITQKFKETISKVGAIIENPDMYTYMTGYDNLLINANIYNVAKERIEEVIKLVGLEKRINDKVNKYSLGMKQRLGIAQAILHQPKLLILDEPTNGLDPEGINELRNLLIKLAKEEKMAIIVSSHILRELESFCNKICIIQNGKITCNTTMNILKNDNEIIEYIIEVNNIKLDKIIDNYKIIDNNHILVNSTKERLVNIIKALLLNDINIYEIKKQAKNLEEIFLDYTKGNIID